MFDYHIHTKVSFDGRQTGEEAVAAAEAAGLKEICFTDHLDYDPLASVNTTAFDTQVYHSAYDHLQSSRVKIRRGMEFGMLPNNQEQLKIDIQRRQFDFVLGSVHYVDGYDVYFEPYWQGKTVFQVERRYLETTLQCVENHDDFDVLAHLTYISKTRANPLMRPVPYDDYRELLDAILCVLVKKGKGLELNTSGVDRCGDFLPGESFFRRFRELGGEIVTVGSDAHSANRVGQYTNRACELLKNIFGYVCTFENRKPVFHKL